MTTITTLFSGGEGVGAGARMAGLVHLNGIELNNNIAQVARDNHFDTITADVLTVDPALLPIPDILHASPVCTRASVANANGEESDLDIDAAKKMAEFITVMRPKYFTLENVFPYRHFESFELICDVLRQANYSFDYWHLNSADYGVPQTRRRLILIAKLDGGMNRIQKPIPTHHSLKDFDDNQMSLFAPSTKPWVGWYEAIEDLIPFLPESEFAPWQLDRLPENIKESVLFASGKYDDYIPRSMKNMPSGTITSDDNQIWRRAFIIDDKLNDRSTSLTKLFDYQNTSRDMTLINSNHPSMTISWWHGRGKSHAPHAWLSQGHVVRMTARALARFQSFPDWYRFPDKNSLAVKVIGNAVPPLLACHMLKAALL